MEFQWYPGHMTKARREMQDDLKLVDLIIEIVDARIPQASRNPDLMTLGQQKARMILLNKADMADENATEAWKSAFTAQGYGVAAIDARKNNSLKRVRETISEACREKIERDQKRGIKNRPIRAMVVGIPNVGKSTFINSFAGKAVAKTGNKPGVTRGRQWIRLDKNVELLDTPGILWGKFEDQRVGLLLALTGSIKDEVLETEELSLSLITLLTEDYPGLLDQKYGEVTGETAAITLSNIAKNRGCVKKGNELDYGRAANLLLDDFRNGRLGRITLEQPEDIEATQKGDTLHEIHQGD